MPDRWRQAASAHLIMDGYFSARVARDWTRVKERGIKREGEKSMGKADKMTTIANHGFKNQQLHTKEKQTHVH